jgi:Ca-activated chloride channel family protein
MTHDHDTTNGPAEELLTAYALGECTAAERAAVERLLDDDAAAAGRIDDVRRIADTLKAAAESERPARSADLRRAVIAAAARGTATSPAARPGGRGRLAWALAGLTGLAAAVVVAFLPAMQLAGTPRQVARRQPAPARTPPVVAADAGAGRALEELQAVVETESLERKRVDEQGVALAKSMPTASAQPQEPAGDRLARNGNRQWGLTREAADHPAPAFAAAPRGIVRRQGEEFSWHERVEDGKHLDAARRTDRERYDQFVENRFLRTADAPLSTFSIDVDTASYANVRRFLAAGRRPPRDAVRIEELVNYFRYARPQPEGDDPFAVAVEVAECPWRPGHRLVRVALAGRDVARDSRPAGNLVFLVDVSGSMGDPDKLPLVKQALLMLVDELTENDRVAIVTYAGDAGLKLPPTSGDQKERIRAAIESLASGGSTHGSAGIELAYEQAAERFIPGGANRVILATDGDLNVGVTDDAALVELIQARAKGGTFLTVLGFGQGNLQDEKMEKLADNGNGIYAYIDGVREARKVLVEQLTGSTITIAKDVKIQVEFNPAVVASYRLLGYENRALADADFRDDTKDAGEIGAGHGVTALYEVALVGDRAPSEGRGAEPLKYRRDEPQPPARDDMPLDEATSRELLTVKLRFKQPEGNVSRLLEVPLSAAGGAFDAASTDLRFAAAVAAFGMILRGSEHTGDATLPMVARIAGAALGDDPGGYRAEFLDLVRRAESAH